MKKLLKSFLLAVCLLVGGVNSAWAENYVTVYSQDFEDAETYRTDWVQPKSGGATISQASRTKNAATVHFYQALRNGSGPRTTQFVFPSVFKSYNVNYKFDFYWAMGTTYGNHGHSTLKISNANNVQIAVMDVAPDNDNNQTYYYKGDGTTEIGHFKMQGRGTPSTFYHVTLEGIVGEGIYITVKTEDDVTTKIAKTLLTSTYSYLGKMDVSVARSNYDAGQGFDDFTFSINIDQYKTRATAATTAYNAVKNKVMNTSVKSALDDAKDDLDAFADDDDIAADVSGYVDAIEALETANENAQTSIDNFIILNNLIGNSKPAGYVAPDGVASPITENSTFNPVTKATEIRAAVITAGTVNNNTDITAVIVNNSFELGSTLGWTTVASDDTGAKGNSSPYTTSGIDGSWQFNTWSQGTPITQTIGTLPAGQYKLAALVASDGGTIYLKMNNTHNSGVITTAEGGGTYVDNEYTFTLATETEVTIGAVGSNDDGSYTDDGHWWYKADKFTLTYVGQDPLALAKVSLEAEIETATALYNSWTPKVGTTPFKYDATYYNALNTAIGAAQDVIDADGDVVSAYTSAEDALETAESNMASSTQNAPDPDKYYQIFVANNDGTASDYNLYMLYEKTKTQVKVSATPYPVKFEAITSGLYNGRYYIKTPYGNSLCCDGTNQTTAYVSGADGVSTRLAEIAISLQDNGAIKMYGTKSGDQYKYSASASEGAGVTAKTTDTGTWVVSAPVDVTDVKLAVNATTCWGTFIAPYENLIPSTVKAYTVSHKGSGYIYLEENETGVLSANTPYILSTEEASDVSVALKGIANNDKDTYEDNGLVGLLAAKTVPANSYILQYQAGKVGTAFYKLENSLTGTKYRCYLDLANVPTSSSSRAFIRMSIFDDETTSIENLTPALSEGEGVVYNLRGQRVAKPTKGLYIVNGQKVVIK